MRLLFVALFVTSISVYGQSSLPPCPADTSAYWNNCFGTGTFRDGRKYVGEWRDNKYHGQGALTSPNGVKYVGEHRDGLPNGRGTWTFPNGSTYVGEHRDGKFHGQGIQTWSDGMKYVGEFRDDKSHGRGTYTAPNGEKYVGEFRDDKRHGQGIRYAANGSILESGRWENDKLVQSLTLDTVKFPFDPDRVARDQQAERLAREASERKAAEAKQLAERTDAERRRVEAERLAAEAKQQQTAEAQESEQRRQEVAKLSDRRVAMVIGNSNYKVNRLDNPVNDATDMATALRGLGFEVTLLLDATLSQMRAATRKFEESVLGADVALIFYAGHGIEAKGRNYMIPVSADIQREYELDDQAYNAGQWLDMLEGAKGKNAQRVNIVILDACRDNSLTRSWRNSVRGLGRMDAPSGTVLVYSTAPGKVAADGAAGQRNSPFTKHLLQSLQTPNVPIELVLRETRRRVVAETKGEQVPWEHSSLIGEFVFRVQR